MSERRRIFYMILIMVMVALAAAIVSIGVLYQAAFDEQEARLVETAQSQARLIEAVARFDAEQSRDYPGGSWEATLSQVREAHENYEGFGETGEFTLAQLEGNMIVFLLNHRHRDLQDPDPVSFDSERAEPMRLALSGFSGTVVGLDYRGEVVLAAHEPVAELDMGIVAKIDLAEVRQPFIWAGLIAGIIVVVLIVFAALGFLRMSNPIIKRLEDSLETLQTYSGRLEEMVEDRTKELEEAHETMIRTEKLAFLGELAGGVGHELRNPLGVITNAVYYLESTQPVSAEKLEEYLGIIASEALGASRIVGELLDYARVQQSQREFIAISELVSDVLEKSPPPENINVAANLSQELPPSFIDAQQIKQVFTNLVTNAYQAMPQGGELIISTHVENGQIQLSIADTGMGISEDNMKKLFEPLFTTKARGIGLGLALSNRLVEANGGNILVESEEGKGATFIVSLPVQGDKHA
ncbi:MAG: hypothetical protein FVQ83_07520 [Chloroflexi bacterium]|nr:hypothetical protein [Chloroflexota bacterium]